MSWIATSPVKTMERGAYAASVGFGEGTCAPMPEFAVKVRIASAEPIAKRAPATEPVAECALEDVSGADSPESSCVAAPEPQQLQQN